jgi:hypothetical protein
MLAPSGSRVHVAVPSRAGRARRAGIAVHRPMALDAEDVTTHDGLPLTTPTRTLVDLAATVRRRELRRALAEAERLRLPIDPQAIDRLATRPGARRLQAALADLRVADGWTRSELEREFLRLAERAGLPQPAVNTVVAGHEVDFAWHRPAPLVVETDGHAFHHTRQAFEDDHARTVALRLAGYDVLRVTHRQVVRDPDTVIKALRQALEPTPPRPWTQGRGEARTTTS